MACFLVPGTEAIVTTIVTAVVKHKEKNHLKEANIETKDISEKIGTKFSNRAEIFGGVILIAIGVEIFISGMIK